MKKKTKQRESARGEKTGGKRKTKKGSNRNRSARESKRKRKLKESKRLYILEVVLGLEGPAELLRHSLGGVLC